MNFPPDITPFQMLGYGMAYTTLLFFLGAVYLFRTVSHVYNELIDMQRKINAGVERQDKLRHAAMEESNAVWKQLRNLVEIAKEMRQLLVTRRP
jgi:hypothetical protein